MTNEQILIDVITNYDNGLKKVERDGKKVIGTFEKTDQVGGKLVTTTKKVVASFDKLNGISTGVQKISTSFKKVAEEAKKVTRSTGLMTDALNQSLAKRGTFDFNKQLGFDVAHAGAQRLGKELAKTTAAGTSFLDMSKNMRGSLLGVGFAALFGGMALKRLFSSIARAGVTSFMKIIETTNNMSSATQQLNAHWEYLKFTIGSAINRALEPLMPFLIRLINFITEFVQKNPEKVFKLLIGGIIAFTAIMVAGQTLLALASFASLVKDLKDLGMLKSINLGNKITGLGALKGLSAVVGVVLSLGAIKGFKDMLTDLKTSWGDRAKNLLQSVFGGALIGFAVGGAGGAIAGAIVGLGISLVVNFLDIAWENNLDTKLIAFFTTLKEYIQEFPSRFINLFKISPTIEIDLDNNIMKHIPKKKLGDKIRDVFSFDDYFGEGGTYQNIMSGAVDRTRDALKDTGDVIEDNSTLFDPLTTQVSNLSNAFGTKGQGLNEAMNVAVNDRLPALKEELGNLTSTLETQTKSFNNTAGAIERYNRALEGSTKAES